MTEEILEETNDAQVPIKETETKAEPEATANGSITDQETAVVEDEVLEEPLTLEELLEATKAEAAKNLDGWQRTQAEFANARKRFEKQRADAYVNATADVIAKLLPALDDFDRALGSVPQHIAEDNWFEGIQLVQRKLSNILEYFNVAPIEAVGQPFDPNIHEALSQEPSDDYETGHVTRELQKGYKLGERVIRASLVYVAE